MILVPVKLVDAPRRLSFSATHRKEVFDNADKKTRVFEEHVNMEVYTGWIRCDWHPSGGTLENEEVVSYLLDNEKRLRAYDLPSNFELQDYTVTAVTSFESYAEDEANLVALDEAKVQLKPQSLAGVAGHPLCLVLRARLGAIRTELNTITYQVTVLTPPPKLGSNLELGNRGHLAVPVGRVKCQRRFFEPQGAR